LNYTSLLPDLGYNNTMSPYINKQDFNQATTSQSKAIWRQMSLLAYDSMMGIIGFISSMVRMFLGK
jgi:hypothetical protein